MKKLTAILLSCLMLLSLCACGQSASPAKQAYSADSYVSAPAAAYGGFRDDSYAYDVKTEEAYDWPTEEPVPEAKTSGSTGVDAPALDPEKIIYSASVTVETTEFDASIAMVDTLVARYGGFVESSSLNGRNYYSQSRGYVSNRSADYTLRIPSNRFHELMSSLSELGNVPYSHTYSENISAQYYDVEARLTACRTQEARLLEMMEKAETVKDLIQIEDRLSELRYQIESLQSTLKNWDRQVSYSSVNLSISEVTVYTPTEEPSYWEQFTEALKDGFRATADFFKNFALGLAEIAPLLIIVAVLLLIFVPRFKKRKAAKKAKKEAAQQAVKEASKEAPKEEPKE